MSGKKWMDGRETTTNHQSTIFKRARWLLKSIAISFVLSPKELNQSSSKYAE
jgi:hypothetical protein